MVPFHLNGKKVISSPFTKKDEQNLKNWRDGVIFNLEQNGISGDLLNIPINFLSNRMQRVKLNGQILVWACVNAELLIYIYI